VQKTHLNSNIKQPNYFPIGMKSAKNSRNIVKEQVEDAPGSQLPHALDGNRLKKAEEKTLKTNKSPYLNSSRVLGHR
jgi:hypothetical protein